MPVCAEYRTHPTPPSPESATNKLCPKAPHVSIPLFTLATNSGNMVPRPQCMPRALNRWILTAQSGFQSLGNPYDIWSDRTANKESSPAVLPFTHARYGPELRIYLLSYITEDSTRYFLDRSDQQQMCHFLTHSGRVTQICVFNTRLFSLHNTLNYATHRACLRMVLLTDVYRNLTSLWIKL